MLNMLNNSSLKHVVFPPRIEEGGDIEGVA